MIVTKQRDTYFDFLRGIAIIMVIGIHTYVDGLMHFNLFLRQFLNCAVPIFLAISGFFIGRKSFEGKGSYIQFLGKQIPRVYLPMLFWSIPWVLLSLKAGNNPLLTVLKAFAGEMSIFYFIILIIQYYVLTLVIQKANIKIGGGYSIIVTIIGITIFDYVMRIKGMKLSMVQSGSPFPVWMAFYVMGVLKAQNIKFPFQTIRPWIGAAIGMTLCVIYIAWIHTQYGSIAHGIKLSSHIYSYFVIMWLFSDNARSFYKNIQYSKVEGFIVETGRLSFFIYLTHCLILFTFSIIHIPNLWSVRWPLCIVLSYIFARLCDKRCPVGIKKYIGF